ncbi:restriction of telomere capping protein 4, partial [Gymnopilus junonius]
MSLVKKKGLRAVSGVHGQFANFEKTQPGYYGELGSVIIHQTLYNMFPLDTINPALTAPLTANEFIERILVPEVALRLVLEDKDLDIDTEEDVKEALEILRDSSSYGVAMFPEDGGEWG